MNPLYRCRSDPQIAVEVIFTIASRELRIFGSGTSWTSTWVLPIHVVARMMVLRSIVGVRSGGDRLGRALEHLPASPRALRRALRTHHLTGLQHLLKPPQV